MSFIKCFDVVSMVCEEATKKMSSHYKLNERYLKLLENCCEGIDLISDDTGGTSYIAFVNEVNNTISITLECEYMPVNDKDHPFVLIIKKAVSFGFSISQNGKLNINFVFPSIWDKI